jgi:hypothetical protein
MANFWEQFSGTSKQSYGESLYDAKEMKKWKGEQDKWYKDLGDTRDRYGKQSSKFMGRYEDAEGEADRYRGKAETEFGSARRSMGRADTSFGRSQADINRARQSQSSANAMMADRDHYSNLARNAEERRQGIKGDRLQMQSLRGRLGKPAQDTGMTQRLMDAFKGSNESNREIMEANTAQLAKVNPVAAARMQAQFNEGTLKSLGQLKQQGMVTDQQLGDNNLTREAGILMDSTSLYGQEAAQDQMQAGYHQQQIQNFGAAGTQALNTASAEGNIARGQLSQASQYANLGGQYGNMGSQLDARAGRALGAGMQYEGMGYQALQDQTSISNRRVERQDKFKMSDAAARARVDSFNRSRGQQGFSNVMKVVETGARIYGAAATAGASELAIQAMKTKQANDQKKKENALEVSNREESPGYLNARYGTTSSPRIDYGSFDLANRGGGVQPVVQPAVQSTAVNTGQYGPASRYQYPSYNLSTSAPPTNTYTQGSGFDQLDMSQAYTGPSNYSSIMNKYRNRTTHPSLR